MRYLFIICISVLLLAVACKKESAQPTPTNASGPTINTTQDFTISVGDLKSPIGKKWIYTAALNTHYSNTAIPSSNYDSLITLTFTVIVTSTVIVNNNYHVTYTHYFPGLTDSFQYAYMDSANAFYNMLVLPSANNNNYSSFGIPIPLTGNEVWKNPHYPNSSVFDTCRAEGYDIIYSIQPTKCIKLSSIYAGGNENTKITFWINNVHGILKYNKHAIITHNANETTIYDFDYYVTYLN